MANIRRPFRSFSALNPGRNVNNANAGPSSESKVAHLQSDVDTSVKSLHHTLGAGNNQSSPGNHFHDGITSKFIVGASIAYVLTTVDQHANNDATVNNDTELIFPLVADATYEVEFWISFLSTVGGDIRTCWAVPTGSTGVKMVPGPTSASAGYTSRTQAEGRWGAHDLTTEIAYQLDTSGNGQLAHERGILVTDTTAGNLTFQFSQFTATVGNLTRRPFSSLKVTRIR